MDPITIAMGLAQFAPQVLKWITGSDKAADAAGAVVEIAQQVTGKGSGDEAFQALKADPALVLQFRQAIAAQEADLDKAYLADIQNARSRDVDLHKSGYRNTRADVMVLLDVIGLIACLVVIAMFRAQLPGEVVGLLTAIAANFGACLRDAHQFEFGSSRSSREKDATLASIAKG